jgi:predicted phosphodiesterase
MDTPKTLRIWASCCCHVGTDLTVGNRKSLADAIQQSENGGSEGGPPFEWDVALHLGDFSGAQTPPQDEEGEEVIRQFDVLEKHSREQFYCVVGNHDASGPNESCQWWFRKWIDPTGEHTEHSGVDPKRRPYPIEGTWERYSFRIGNILFLMMGDRNDGGPPIGRAEKGGYPAGAVTGETFEWWKEMVDGHADGITLSAHHHMLKETTVGSGPWEGYIRKGDKWIPHYHGYFPKGAPEGASYLYFVDGKPDAQAFEKYLAENPGATDLWLGGHTHTHPDDTLNGRSHIEQKWGTNFINVASLSRHHAGKTTMPISRLLTFTEGSNEVKVQCYLHTSDHAPQGWYPSVEQTIKTGKPFSFEP